MQDSETIGRRDFIRKGALSAAGILFASHLDSQQLFSGSSKEQNLISEIRIDTNTPLDRMTDFYHGSLGLKLLSQTPTSCSFRAGVSILMFKYNSTAVDSPFYHFAFNIPENKIAHAEEWQLKRSDIIEPPAHLKDLDNYSKNIVYFRHWDAHSVFFYDPSGNIVEYIARHTCSNSSKGSFSPNDILYISEIGLVVSDVNDIHHKISNHYGLKKYSSSSNQFLAMGDELGLILLMQENTRAIFKKGRKRSIYYTEVHLNQKDHTPLLNLEGYPYKIS